MSEFIVSARKYRPATFASVIGQRHITSTLKNAIEREQLAHAYLFCGPRGVGKTTCARIFAKAINCLSPNGAEACNECESCQSFNQGRSLNIHELDAASNNSVEDIRSLIEQVRIVPQLGRYSLFIIDEVHMLSAAAFNAFLKTLEEPPAHAIFILATTEKHKILPTILSRCQIYDFNRIKVDDAVEYLRYIANQEGVTSDDESLNLIAQKADGGMRDALSMFDKAVSFCGSQLNYKLTAQTLNVLDYDTYFTIVESLLEGDYTASLLAFDGVIAQGFSPQTFITGLNRHLRDLLVSKDSASLSLLEYTGSLLKRYEEQASRSDVALLFGAISILTDADSRIRQSSNQRLLVELSLMKIASLGKKKTLIPDNDFAHEHEATLPDLDAPSEEIKVVERVVAAPAPKEEVVEVIPEVAPAPEVETAKAEAIKEETAIVEEVKVEAAVPAAKPVRKLATPLLSLSDLLNKDINTLHEENSSDKAVEVAPTARRYDDAAEQKLNDSTPQIMEHLASWRPRFIPTFEKMTIEGSTIKIEVPSSELMEEIQRSQSELLLKVIELAKIDGVVDLEIVLNEQIKASKPIKIEDKMEHLLKINPLLTELRAKLNLDIE